jgi:hypothetical protein
MRDLSGIWTIYTGLGLYLFRALLRLLLQRTLELIFDTRQE